MNFCLCICTFKRPNLLNRLLLDLHNQTILPNVVIIIDADPDSGKVKGVLEDNHEFCFFYVPSDHANISYQRFLGWKTAQKINAVILVYIDDDIRIHQSNAIELLLSPFLDKNDVLVGSTATIISPNLSTPAVNRNVIEFDLNRVRTFIHSFSWKSSSVPGSLTPTGVRIKPTEYSVEGYGKVKWAYGGVMGFNMSKLDDNCFLDDSFALHHIGCGLGEDTLISHLASFKGDIYLIPTAEFIHPNADISKAYPSSAYKLGYATAYSRRLINDHFHEKPLFIDRLLLIRSYFSTNIINAVEFMISFKLYPFLYTIGYLLGSLRGIIQKPAAGKLTPNIDWRHDAEEALAKTIVIQ